MLQAVELPASISNLDNYIREEKEREVVETLERESEGQAVGELEKCELQLQLTVLQAVELPAGISNLATGLTNMD